MSTGGDWSASDETDPSEKPGSLYFSELLESIEHLSWDADQQFAYLIRERLPITELHEAFFDYIPGGLTYLVENGYLTDHQHQALLEFDRLLAAACTEPWRDSRDGLVDPRWAEIRPHAHQLLATIAGT